MSKGNNLARRYAADNGEMPGTFDFEITVKDYLEGYSEGGKHAAELRTELRAMLSELKRENARLRQSLVTARRLLEDTHRLPQNQRWNTLYPHGEVIRKAISKFLSDEKATTTISTRHV